ncbi:MAG: flagellar basal body rod protein FlgC [Solirubrobacterales bacterium 70-9]|nr:MAG: flagellar basal body rod protein FlgC [Solirubrobacterales bacterium 70-9]
MSLFGALEISASGLTAQRLRMDVTSANLANAQTTRTPGGGPYRRQTVVLQESAPASGAESFAGNLAGALGGGEGAPAGVEVAAIVPDTTPLRRVYEPGNPEADGQGYVTYPNVNPVTEMTDLIDASRSYQADITAMQTTKTVFQKTIELL